MNSVASTLNRVTGMEFNNQISVLTPNNWNTWKHDMQVLLMHYGCWQFIIQTKPEQPDEEATYKEKLDLQLRFQLIRWLPQEFQSTVQQIYRWKEEDFRVVKIEAELILEANRLQLMKQDLEKAENAYLSSFTSKKSKTLPGATAAAHGYPNGKNDYQKRKVVRFCEAECSLLELDKQLVTSCILFEENSDKGVWVIDTAATSHFCNDKSLFLDLKPITNMKMSLATEDKSCPVEGIGTLRFRVKYKGSFHEITLADVLFNPKLRRNLLSGSRLESKGAHFVGTKDGIKTLLKSSEVPHKFLGEALLCFTYAWNRICHKDSNKTPFEKYSGRKPSVLHLKPFGCLAYAGVPKQIRKKFDMRAKIGIMMGYAQRTKGYRIWSIDENKLVETINVRFDENKRGINFRQKVNSNLGYNLNLPDYYDDEDDFDRVKDSLTSRLVSKTSTETPSTSEKPDVSSDNHSLIPCTEVKWIRNIGRKVTGSNVYYSIEGEATRLKSFNEIERYCKRHNIKYDPSLFNFRRDNTESQGFSDLQEQQEALMVEVTIPNCYKQAIRSRDASKWHDAMDKEINVMMERKVWDLVDHPDNIKILENRWVYTIKYDENNKIVRYKARLVARGNTQLRGESFDEVFQEYKLELSKVKSLKLRCYSDSDFATNRDDRVSMGGFITFIDETPISSLTFKQKSVSLSTMEADSTSEMQRHVIVTGIVRNCGHGSRSTADTGGRRLQTNAVCWEPQKKKSKELRSGVHGGQAVGLLRPFHLPRHAIGRWLCTTIEKYAGAPSCMSYTSWCAVVSTPCSNSGRSGKFENLQVSSTLPRRSCGRGSRVVKVSDRVRAQYY
ncbi:retrovirus-related Pol polyprotein from transposon RE1 [Trichonephila clavipes]|nr:retrovirus-related Pol polyprotein from transposon RE1 [Trichonephila clavipes]